jgi:hypothetical protein
MKKIIVTVLAFFCGAARVLAQSLTPEEARATSYRVQHSYFVDHSDPEFKATWNTLARVYTPGVGGIAVLCRARTTHLQLELSFSYDDFSLRWTHDEEALQSG